MIGIFSNVCPRCGKGKVFSGLYAMNERCPECSHRFGREEGFFLGAMVFSYIFAILSCVPTVAWLAFGVEAPAFWIIAAPCLQLVVLNPLIFRWSRLAWIRLADRIDPLD